jgi:hypothetical protein
MRGDKAVQFHAAMMLPQDESCGVSFMA